MQVRLATSASVKIARAAEGGGEAGGPVAVYPVGPDGLSDAIPALPALS